MKHIADGLRLVAKSLKSGFPMKEFKQEYKTLHEVQEVAKAYLQEIGRGGHRAVYRFGSGKVMKVALDDRGIGQNRAEAKVWHQLSKYENPLVTKVFDIDIMHKGLWITAEMVKPYGEGDGGEVVKNLGLDEYFEEIEELVDFCNHPEKWRQTYLESMLQLPEDVVQSVLAHPIIKAIDEIIHKHGVLYGDLQSASHWGRTSATGRTVILDYGFTHEVWRATKSVDEF